VIAVDTNVLVAAHRRDADRHAEAARTVKSLAQGGTRWSIPWACLHEFLAVVTHPRIFEPPSTTTQALDQIAAWLDSPSLELLPERFDHWEHLRALVEEGDVRGGRVHDARVAAVCLSHGVTTLLTADRDFGRFPRLRVANPLVG
jgi:toxin-antitoxin system PIN domain toxin